MTQALIARERDGLNLSKLPRELLERRPIVPALQEVPERLVPFGSRADAGSYIHFFLDDYRFQRVWSQPERYLALLLRYEGVLSPDFSLFWDDPEPVQRWNDYRNKWLAAFWNANGLKVIPTISWSDEASFEWCFEGWPSGGTVAVSIVGTRRTREAKELFLRGYLEMYRRLEPSTVLIYGTPVPLPGPVKWYEPFYAKFEE